MKSKLHIFSAILFTIASFSFVNSSAQQLPCSIGTHQVFTDVSNEKPVLLNRLGTSPQFGEIAKHTADGAYKHLANVHRRNTKGSRKEIDTFLMALGYNGFSDPAFSVAKITPSILKKGKTGWMGAYSRGHKYKWSVLGNDFETFKIEAKDGSCFAYIMKKCGNAFFDPLDNPKCTDVCDPKCSNYDPTKCPPFCKTQTLTFAGNGKIQASDVINSTENLPVVVSYAGKTLCVGEYTVPVRLTYEMTASGDVNYAKTVQVCDYGSGIPANLSLNLPVNINYSLAASDISVGEDGKMVMNVSKKQYKTLKKVYAACPANVATANATNTTLAANKVSTSSEASESISSTGNVKAGGNNCVKQTLKLSGSAVTEGVSVKQTTQEVTLIGVYKKVGKLQAGETAEKYMCLGAYNVPANTSLQYALKGSSNLDQIIEVCDNGSVKPVEEISVPLTMTNSFTKQDLMVGDYGRVYMPLTKKQYKKLSKSFKRCCGDGSTSTKCF